MSVNRDLLFDVPAYLEINHARWEVAERLLEDLKSNNIQLETCFDFGAGPGWFAKRLCAYGLDTIALEARVEIVEVGRKRVPECRFELFDFDDFGMDRILPPRDFSLAFGILYHLESPLRALRMMAKMTKKIMLLETMIIPGEDEFARIVKENPNETQGMQPLATILTQSAVERAIWACGFEYIYQINTVLDHADFKSTEDRHPRRSIWVMCRTPLKLRDFKLLELEVPKRANYWEK